MNGYPSIFRRRILLLFLAVYMCLWHASELRSQDAIQPDASESGCTVALRYTGTDGLARSAPKDTALLRHVDIAYGTKLTADDVAFLSTLENTEELLVGGNLDVECVSLAGSLAPLGKMRKLRRIALCKQDVRDEDLAFVAGLPVIETLEFFANTNPSTADGPVVTDDCAVHLCKATTLRELRIFRGSTLTDRFVALIAQHLKRLEYFELDSDLLTDKSLRILADECPNLRWLDLHSNRFTDEGVACLANAKKLEMLWLGSKSLTADCVSAVSGLVHLRHLELTVPTIDDAGIKSIAGLPALELLALRQPPLSDEQFAMLANHPALQSAFLNGRDLSAPKVLQVIETMPMLDHLEVRENRALQVAINAFLANRKTTR